MRKDMKKESNKENINKPKQTLVCVYIYIYIKGDIFMYSSVFIIMEFNCIR